MIDLIFMYGTDSILIRIHGNSVLFGTANFMNQLADISGLKLDYVGVIREFPDLEVRKDWREEAIKRFKDKIKLMNNEKDIELYIIEELSRCGYKPLYRKKNGFRAEKLR